MLKKGKKKEGSLVSPKLAHESPVTANDIRCVKRLCYRPRQHPRYSWLLTHGTNSAGWQAGRQAGVQDSLLVGESGGKKKWRTKIFFVPVHWNSSLGYIQRKEKWLPPSMEWRGKALLSAEIIHADKKTSHGFRSLSRSVYSQNIFRSMKLW